MHLSLQTLSAPAAGFFVFVLFLYFLLRPIISNRRPAGNGKQPPVAKGAWPLMGHLHLLRPPKLPHITLGAMADQHGPIFTLRLGIRRAVVISTSEMVKECFTSNDKAFMSRPDSIAIQQMGYNFAMFGFARPGPYWREIRKITVLELLSNHRLSALRHVWESEVTSAIKSINAQCMKKTDSFDVTVEMTKWFADLTMNLMFRIIAGKKESPERERWGEAMKCFFELTGLFTIGDAMPFLRWADFGGYEKKMRKTAAELDVVLQGWLEEHKQTRSSGEGNGQQSPEDFMDVMMSLVDEVPREAKDFDSDTIIKATCLGLVLGGSGTTAISLTWALALLLNNPHALTKVQEELDTHVGRTRQVKESDISNLNYLYAVIKETMRLCPPAQLSPPREAMEPCTVGGYLVPAGTSLFANLWKIQRDPRVWSEPEEFRPERFLTSTHMEVDVKGQHFELIPFGSGRRACPGISFGLQVIQFTLARLLHGFDVKTTSGEPVDMTTSFGFANPKSMPTEVLLAPRLPAEVY